MAHLRSWLGAWPPATGLQVVGSDERIRPGWNGRVRAVAGVVTPDGAVLSVPPGAVRAVEAAADAAGGDLAVLGPQLPELLDQTDAGFETGVYRWATSPPPVERTGVWVPNDDPRIPEWLRPFNGDVLVAFADGADGPVVAAGVGRKQHDRHGHELAVVTEEPFRGRGLARQLVAQAAHRVLADGAVPIYLHDEANLASARTADAAGFRDVGWRIVGIFGGDPDQE